MIIVCGECMHATEFKVNLIKCMTELFFKNKKFKYSKVDNNPDRRLYIL